ncbi:glycerol kinase [Maritimibacter alkaliphilus HTCC2654]|uniref:Glycerol kinase n=1 Tax=Maritimibacter alkaliphilus HTCC2654 TaxID=314271 RepID=A3VKN6_9RHOB|nr:glycerol kinase GlpK [Maritimibacter alkaliphilus]EAQ11207.1 glycerol kinase [Rhodobacterales bacterium HTCC2654] [Maritimibacter alkaliphilus HTCC2654]TYP83014.1 glycerol kinase [Maritimibacter alkaliphilus HTCC2654]
MTHILALDQGTTSSRAIAFDGEMRPVASAQREFDQHFPRSGWVEHEPEDIWDTTLATAREVAQDVGGIAAIGITNQRETVVVWDRETGKAIHRAIVWQDRRTSDLCHDLRGGDFEELVRTRTGLLVDPYFSSTKVKWLLDEVEGARAAAEAGKLAFGTVDTFLIWRLTEGRVHATDATNAARTMLYDIHKGAWDADICEALGIPMSMLPDVRDSDGDFGETTLLGGTIPIRGVAGDQQAATIGQACFTPGMIKSTYGTGCFALLNTGDTAVASENRLLTTIAYQMGGQVTYALEGSIFVAGAVVQWLRDGLGILGQASDAGPLARKADPGQDVILVPAFTGLGAPYWDAECRGAVYGLTRNSGPAEFAKAALESVGFQTRDLLDAMEADMGKPIEGVLRVDGGMSASRFAMQFLADITGAPVDRPPVLETTAMGAAWLAGQAIGIYPDAETFASGWSAEMRFDPKMDPDLRADRYAAWKDAVRRTLTRG